MSASVVEWPDAQKIDVALRASYELEALCGLVLEAAGEGGDQFRRAVLTRVSMRRALKLVAVVMSACDENDPNVTATELCAVVEEESRVDGEAAAEATNA